MIVENRNNKKNIFSGHESFQCRHLWLKKGCDFVNKKKSFNNVNAVVELGIQKNMESSTCFCIGNLQFADNNRRINRLWSQIFIG